MNTHSRRNRGPDVSSSKLVGKSIMKLAREGHESRLRVYLKMLLDVNAFDTPEKVIAITDMFVSGINENERT